jgi:hypothetical protein
MTEIPTKRTPETAADERIREILRAIDSWAADATSGLVAPVRAVCLRLAEMIADQRHHHLLHPEPLDAEQQRTLELVAERLRTAPMMRGLEHELEQLTEVELRSTGSWATVPGAQAEWTATAIQYLERRAATLPAGERPDPYWADDLVAGVIASLRSLMLR